MIQTTILAAEGWDSVTNMVNSLKIPIARIGIAILTVTISYVALKVAVGGKGKAREIIQDIGMQALAGILIGLAATMPALLSEVGVDIGNSTNGGGGGTNSTVHGQ